MKGRAKRYQRVSDFAKIIAAVFLCLLFCALSASAGTGTRARADASSASVIAEKVIPSELAAGDEIVIVAQSRRKALCTDAVTSARLGIGQVTIAQTETRQVLTDIPIDAAILELIPAEDGWYFHCGAGYLTCSAAGDALYFSQELEEGSRWQFSEEKFLYNPSASLTKGTVTYRNYHLEYYSTYFTMYGKRSGGDEIPFTMDFYRMGNSLPEEPILPDPTYFLPVLETSDVHGYLANVTEDGEVQYPLACIADIINSARVGGRDHAVVLDGGDIFQGTTLSNLTRGHALSAAYAMIGYDAVTVGNHEFDWGLSTVIDSDGTMMDYDLGEDWQGANNIPVVISNLYQGGGKVSWGRDCLILNKTAVNESGQTLPVKIGVIGLAGDYGSSILTENFGGAGYSIQLDYNEVNALAQELESAGECDATILLAHESASTVAWALGKDSVIDLVLGGHTHRNVCAETTWGLQYVEPSCNSKGVGRVELGFSLGADGPVFTGIGSARVISVPALTNDEYGAGLLDQRIVALTDHVAELMSGLLNTQVGLITEPVLRYTYLPGSGDRSTTCGNWMTSILARIYGADAAFVNSGGMRLDFPLDKGKEYRAITRSDIYTMFPFANRVYFFELTWEDMLEALRYSLTSGGKSLLSDITGVTCHYADGEVLAIVNGDGTVVYADGAWRSGWQNRTLTVSVAEYVVTTDRTAGGMSNPFVSWVNTPRLLASDKIDNVSAIDVLEEEAAIRNGYLFVDTNAHYVNGPCQPPQGGEDVILLPGQLQVIEAEAFEGIAAAVLVVPRGCASIQAGAFKNCTELQEIWLPAGCDVDPFAFEGCDALGIPY